MPVVSLSRFVDTPANAWPLRHVPLGHREFMQQGEHILVVSVNLANIISRLAGYEARFDSPVARFRQNEFCWFLLGAVMPPSFPADLFLVRADPAGHQELAGT